MLKEHSLTKKKHQKKSEDPDKELLEAAIDTADALEDWRGAPPVVRDTVDRLDHAIDEVIDKNEEKK